jgi:hypothetical protein
MHFKTINGATALSAVLAACLGSVALADTIYVQAPRAVESQLVVPSQVVIPRQTTTVVEKQILLPQPAPTVVEERSVISTPTLVEQQVVVPSEPDMVMKRSLTFGTRKPAVTTQSSEVTLQSGPAPVFHRRIQNMKEQVELGLSKGYLSASSANAFTSRLGDLTSEADSVLAEGTPKDLSDRLEKRLTGINIEISNAMSSENQIGSGSQMQ